MCTATATAQSLLRLLQIGLWLSDAAVRHPATAPSEASDRLCIVAQTVKHHAPAFCDRWKKGPLRVRASIRMREPSACKPSPPRSPDCSSGTGTFLAFTAATDSQTWYVSATTRTQTQLAWVSTLTARVRPVDVLRGAVFCRRERREFARRQALLEHPCSRAAGRGRQVSIEGNQDVSHCARGMS